MIRHVVNTRWCVSIQQNYLEKQEECETGEICWKNQQINATLWIVITADVCLVSILSTRVGRNVFYSKTFLLQLAMIKIVYKKGMNISWKTENINMPDVKIINKNGKNVNK